MTRNGYLTLLGSVAAIVIASLASLGLAMIPAIGQPGPGQLIVTTLTGSELINVQPATGPQFVAISATNLATFVNAGGTGGGSFTTLTASSTVTLSPANHSVTISPTGTGTVVINPATASTMDNVAVGGTTPLAGAFTTLSASSGVNSTNIGATTAGTGKFTTLQNTTSAGLTVAVSTDATHTDATLCEDTTSHVVYFGSGTAGICLGTSSMRFKHDIAPLNAGLKQVMALEPISYKLNSDHGDPDHKLYGFTAEQGGTVLPELMMTDTQGKPNTFDYLGVVPVLVKAIQEQQAQIEELKHKLNAR
jgi:Chaperone of endosialidase